ncbi:RICIN domain-containing protein [Lentzea alba]|uniref:RICIN domain-containing protein n=1 Tax=Lentzea alba TaxID=2714351 RepID=UPI0039BF324C
MGMKMLSVALAAIALGAVTVGPASAADGNPVIEITSAVDDKCVQIKFEPKPEQPRLVLADCTGAPEQRWEQMSVGGDKFVLRNLTHSGCVDTSVSLTHDYCDDLYEYQHGELIPDGADTVRIKYGDKHFEHNGFTSVWGSRFKDTDHQRWRVRQVATTPPPADTAGQVVRMEVVGYDFGCLGVEGVPALKPMPCADAPAQKFQRIELGDGGTALRSVVTGKCVEAEDGEEALVHALNDCDAAKAGQRWSVNRTAVGNFRIQSGERHLTPGGDTMAAMQRYGNAIGWQTWYVTAA